MIGRHLCDRFRRRGWAVRALMRRPDEYPFRESGIERFHLDLPTDVDARAFSGATALVHAAYATRVAANADARGVNETGSALLFDAARAARVERIVFLSSFSAATGAPSYYAASKTRVETMLDARSDLVARVGLVLAPDGGVAHRLWRTIARWHLAPVFDGGRQIVQTIHIDDLTQALVRAIELRVSGRVALAEPVGQEMRTLLRAMATAIGASCLLLPVPSRATLFAVRTLERLGIQAPVSGDNIIGLVALRHVDTGPDLRRLGIDVRSAAESVAQIAAEMQALP